MPIFALAIFLSAFLLFQVQPVIARYILPWYGGSPGVWTTCLLFFQVGLLGGYAYAHALAHFFRRRKKLQVGIHLGLLFLALFLLPITPADSLRPDGTESTPVFGIVALLGLTVGVPYLLLSASGPLLQHWFADAYQGRSPYRLYAISNAGSILGLLTYPFLFEPLLAVSLQTVIWSGAFLLYTAAAAFCGALLLRRIGRQDRSEEVAAPPSPPRASDWGYWIAFSTCGSMLLLSLTNQMCQDVAVVPFLWVLPLVLYLLTFVIAFDHSRWYRRPLAIPLAALSVGLVVYLINQQFASGEMHLAGQIAIFLAAIFFGCLVCHGEIVRLKPDSHYLTGFYLAISLGGALGGLFVSVAAPLLFTGYWELHLSFALLAILASLVLYRSLNRILQRWPFAAVMGAWVLLLGALAFGLGRHILESQNGVLASIRGFYGSLRIYVENEKTEDEYRSLYHGRISHGRQYTNDIYRTLATTYYSLDSGVGAIFQCHEARAGDVTRPMHVGVVGLGVGTIASYAREGDRFRFYEINPQVEAMARGYFSFLADAEGEEKVVLGDARISLEQEFEREGSLQFDVLVVDAFSGDSIPLHLLTREAFELYFRHLKEDGILAVHISNLHLDLSDPVRNLASSAGYEPARVVYNPDIDDYHSYYSDWILITRDRNFIQAIEAADFLSDWDREETKAVHWTDDYCNLLQVVEW